MILDTFRIFFFLPKFNELPYLEVRHCVASHHKGVNRPEVIIHSKMITFCIHEKNIHKGNGMILAKPNPKYYRIRPRLRNHNIAGTYFNAFQAL